jgi:aminoglycoside 3-N-acetyltransferase
MLTESEISAGLKDLGLNSATTAIVHSSLRSFGQVQGGAAAVCWALVSTGATLLFPAGSWDMTGVPAPPGLVRPNNAALNAASWEEFDEALRKAVPFRDDLPIDKELGIIPETMRRSFPHIRSRHPIMSYLAVGERAEALVAAQTLDQPLAPLEVLAGLDGNVLQLGVTHTSSTAIHLAEQQMGRSCFYRYAKADEGVWMELPNIPGESHRFDEIEPYLQTATRERLIGSCRARCIPVSAVLAEVKRLIQTDPGVLLCDDPDCRCAAARQQRIIRTAELP